MNRIGPHRLSYGSRPRHLIIDKLEDQVPPEHIWGADSDVRNNLRLHSLNRLSDGD
jgi:hypothetical protein